MIVRFRRTTGYKYHPVGDAEHKPCRRAYMPLTRSQRSGRRYEYRVYDEGYGFPLVPVWIEYSAPVHTGGYENKVECRREDVPEDVRSALEEAMATGQDVVR